MGVSALTNLTVTSPYFLVKTAVNEGDNRLMLDSLEVTEMQKDNTLKVVTVWQDFV
jgi:hypothetical protein